MDWVVAVSGAESAGGELAAETASKACAAFDEHGCILLRGAFPSAIAEAMHRDYLSQLGALDWTAMQREADKPPPNRFLRVGGARYDITLRMTGAFGRPDVFANDLLIKFLGLLLGDNFHLTNFTIVVSHPGASMQHFHRDHDHLFFNPGVGPNLPVYAINVAVPLIDVDIKTGPTAVWLGSHRLAQGVAVENDAMTACELRRGDLMLLDYRTLHTGLPNASRQPRPIVYMVYARQWFFDHNNHVSRIPLDMPLEQLAALPVSVRPLLARAYSYAMRARWDEADASRIAPQPAVQQPAAKQPAVQQPVQQPVAQPVPRPPAQTEHEGPSRGKVGRNEPCPCGSGQKYKQCHGRLA